MADGIVNFGLIQPEASNAFLRGFQGAQDRQLQLAQQQRQNALADLQLRAAQRGEEEALSEREAYKGAAGLADVQQRLMQAGLGKQAIALQKQMQEQRAAQLKQADEELKVGRGIAERAFAAGRAASMSAPGTEKAAVLSVLKQYHGKGIDLSQDLSEIENLPDSKSVLEHVFHKSQELKNLSEMIPSDTGTAIIRTPRFQQPGMSAAQPVPAQLGMPAGIPGQTPPTRMAGTNALALPAPGGMGGAMPAGQPQAVPGGGVMYQKFMTPAQQAAEARAQQQLGMEREKLELFKQEAARKAEGAAEPLSKKEIQAREAKYPQAAKAVQTFDATTNDLISDLQKLKDHPGLNGITGLIYGRTPGVTGKAREAEAIYDRIMARGGFSELQEMRNASPTGGALGNVSNAEGQQLRAAFAAIDRRQDPESVRRAIDDAIIRLQGSKERVRDAYNMTYEYKGGQTESKPAAAPAAGKAKFLGFE